MELMEFLYRVMEELTDAGVPIVFKGAMVLNLAIRGNNPSKVERITRDIDGDWIGGHPTMEEMEKHCGRQCKKWIRPWMFRLADSLGKENRLVLKL